MTGSTIVTSSSNHILYAHWARTYRITNVGAGKCLNIYGSNEQKWLISSVGSQRYIRSIIDKSFGLNVYRSGSPYNCNVHSIIGNETDAQVNILLF